MTSLTELRERIRSRHLSDEDQVLDNLIQQAAIDEDLRHRAVTRATSLIETIRNSNSPGLMEVFLAEYGLSTEEGVALMCLAEALLRVPDTETMDALIEDKIAPSAWGEHLGRSSSPLVNASTWALMLTGKVLQDGQGVAAVLKNAVKRLGEPVIRVAVSRAMKELGAQFVLGQTIKEAVERGRQKQARGYSYSYDMLGEAALTARDAGTYFKAYSDAIDHLTAECTADDIRNNPGISIKLSALHPRYEYSQKTRVMDELVDRTLDLARRAKAAGMGLNIDAEEADRLDLSLDVIETVLRHPDLAGWDGFGVVVQAYGKRAPDVLDWLYALATELDRNIMVRLVKGAYWDTEIKRAQVEGISGFPVFTHKAATDMAYLCCAQKLLQMTDRIYPQFATHNAHSAAMILEMADDPQTFEFQRLHGMGEALYDIILSSNQARCRIYAPVGAHRDLLAYLVRRLLENGANSSFVNQIVDETVPVDVVAADPFAKRPLDHQRVRKPADIYAPERVNSRGWDLHDPVDEHQIDAARAPFASHVWQPDGLGTGDVQRVMNPANPTDQVGQIAECTEADVDAAISRATPWTASATDRVRILTQASELYEAHFGEFFALLTREAGKTPKDAIAELREAVDFLRYYATRAKTLNHQPRGLFACISPWNFPLAIFTGQIAAALAAGNGVLAKPAEPTMLTAALATRLLHQAGVPEDVLQLLPGRGSIVGARLTSNTRIDGVCFTGSTATAQTINRAMAANLSPHAPLIAETGGLNAMIVDSTALPEQAVKDIIASAFQSAGQRCSALRILYLQQDIADSFLKMLFGAMDELVVGDPWQFNTDVGPIINGDAKQQIEDYIADARAQGRVIKQIDAPQTGFFVPPTVIRVDGIEALEREVFGPVLHIATFQADALGQVVDAINASGFGLTFGMHSRIDDRIDQVTQALNVGNIYINRNQIGAIVGSQPFGGEGLSGTGPKAGGPNYVPRFTKPPALPVIENQSDAVDPKAIQTLIDQQKSGQTCLRTLTLPGPTGESNRLSEYGRGVVLCLGPGKDAAVEQAQIAAENGCQPVCIYGGLNPQRLQDLHGFDAVISQAPEHDLQQIRLALASRDGPVIPLLTEVDLAERCRLERHICIDTTAAGGNASLLAEVS
ncbi:bifunctional proline dehydrogenase/L-glutamate gamma-semialdehyde dehydrogenase PutA [Pseudaestuariivita rosea]|uniref:bifunctional proline dehydrogenase/L-glutamate gamma-semialdehyde dehydrogenase PutA n=1 Tax=Pseudaestuariivita rosea TaxID=2763263 RepID=UPI001ABB4FDC|nr:bifunctional proline dehydrogenase/L-glutamate gamma-semialdehyde dehydrogenase PutA [Pseudaestuariivita rosea]